MTRNRRKVVTEMIFVGIILLVTLAFFVFSFKRSIKNGLPPQLIPKKKHTQRCAFNSSFFLATIRCLHWAEPTPQY